MAETSKDAEAAFDAFIAAYQLKYDKAAECLAKDRQALLAFYDFPAEHWKPCGARTRSRAPSPPCGTARSARRAACRTRQRSPWCSSSSMPRKKAGAGSMATTSCPSSFEVSDSPTGLKSPPTPRPRNPKPPPPDPSGHHQDSAIALQFVWSVEKRTYPDHDDRIHCDQPSSSCRRRFALLASLGAADDPTGRRDENWLTGTGAAITGIGSDRRRADTVAFACAFRIPAEGFAVAGFAADLVWAVTVFFAADRVGTMVFF